MGQGKDQSALTPSLATSAPVLRSRLAHARSQTDALFDLLSPAALYERPIPERHRVVFYLGHLEAFDWNLLADRLLGMKAFDPEFNRLFAFGIDPVSGKLPDDAPEDWPSVDKVRDYTRRVREKLDRALEAVDPVSPLGHDGDATPSRLLNAAIEHRLMHAETFAYMVHRLPAHLKRPQKEKEAGERTPSMRPDMVKIPSGRVAMGLSGEGFGWDNEFAFHTAEVAAFEIDRFKTTNAEYLEFIEAGGYDDPVYWTHADWEWKQDQQITHPAFWRQEQDRWLYCGMFEEFPLPLHGPVYVSHAEASAYARWRGKELPTEAEWQRAAYGRPAESQEADLEAVKNAEGPLRGNYGFRHWDPVPVSELSGDESALGVCGMAGNGWEWTSTPFGPFPGFQPFSFYPGYSADFFDGGHYVMKGASARTAECFLRPSFRNWFQPHYPYIYSGFRCVRR